jgi:thiol-disulfide isomerase/thioredoxin
VNSGAQPLKLSDFTGKTVVLLFWGSEIPDLDHFLEIMSQLEKKYAGKPVVVLGVNHDATKILRDLQTKEGSTLTWPNFSDPANKLAQVYRVGSFPLACVLDGKRTLRYIGAPGSFVDLAVESLLTDAKAPAAIKPPATPRDPAER